MKWLARSLTPQTVPFTVCPPNPKCLRESRTLYTKYSYEIPHRSWAFFEPLEYQWLPETRWFLYQLFTEGKYFNEPTCTTLRTSSEEKRTKAENNSTPRIFITCIGTGLDKINWKEIKVLTPETFRTFAVDTVMSNLPTLGEEPQESSGDRAQLSVFAQVQNADKSLKHVRPWVMENIFPKINILHGLPPPNGSCIMSWLVCSSRMGFFVGNSSPSVAFPLTFNTLFSVIGHRIHLFPATLCIFWPSQHLQDTWQSSTAFLLARPQIRRQTLRPAMRELSETLRLSTEASKLPSWFEL